MLTKMSDDGFEYFEVGLSSSYTYALTGRITAGPEVLTEYISVATSLNNLSNNSTVLSYSGESVVYRGGGIWSLTDVLIFTPIQTQLFFIAVTQDMSATDRFSEVSLFVTPQTVKDDFANSYRDSSVQTINVNNTVYGKIETWSTGSSTLKDVDVFKIYLNSNTSYNLFADNNSFGTAPALGIVSDSPDRSFLVEDTTFNIIDFTPIISGYYYIYVGSDQEISYNLTVSINADDTTAPTVSNFSPADEATGFAVGNNIAVTFSEAVQRGTGNIEIRSGSATGAVVETFDAATSNRLVISGSAIIIDPTSSLANDTQYFVVLPSGAVLDLAGNAYTGTSTYNFTTERIDDYSFTAPGVVSIGSAATTGSIETEGDADFFRVSLTAGVTYTFNLSATSGSVDPYLRLLQGDYYLAINDNFGSSFNSQITFTAPSSGTYYLEATANSGVGTYSLQGTAQAADTTAPTVSNFSPADGTTGVAIGSDIYVYFNEPIQRGSGLIQIRSGSATGAIVGSFDAATSSGISILGDLFVADILRIRLPDNLSTGTTYFVTLAQGAIKDLAGNAYAGTTSYDFQTALNTISGSASDDGLVGDPTGDLISGLAGSDSLTGGLGNDTIDGGSNVDTAIVSGLRAAYTVTQTSTGVWSVNGPDGTDTLSNIEYLKFDDQTMRLLPGTGTSVNFLADSAGTYMSGIRDFDGNDLGASSGWKRIGAVDVNGDGDIDQIFVNRTNGRFAEVGTASDGKVYFNDYGWAGETRVVGIYIDPLVQSGEVTSGGPNDSQRRFQNDLNIDNISRVLGAADYDRDGLQEVYFALTDGTAYLHAYMHADGNIQYANYQSQQQVSDYLANNGWAADTASGWFG